MSGRKGPRGLSGLGVVSESKTKAGEDVMGIFPGGGRTPLHGRMVTSRSGSVRRGLWGD